MKSDFSSKVSSKVDPARKTAISFFQIRGLVISLIISLVLIGVGSFVLTSAIGKLADSVEVSNERNGILIGALLIAVAIFISLYSIISTSRWFKKLRLERAARQAVDDDTKELSDSDFTEYSFASSFNEDLNNVMQDDSKKFAIVTPGSNITYSLKKADGTAVIEANTKIYRSIFPVKYTVKYHNYSIIENHTYRWAFFAPSGLSVNLGKFGTVSSPLGAIFTTDYVVDGKLYWNEFYRKGYYFDRTYDGIRSTYSIKKGGHEIAVVADKALQETGNVNVGFLKNLPSIGQFRVKCRDCDLDTILLFCLLLDSTLR